MCFITLNACTREQLRFVAQHVLNEARRCHCRKRLMLNRLERKR